jgi:hypothetical protein
MDTAYAIFVHDMYLRTYDFETNDMINGQIL